MASTVLRGFVQILVSVLNFIHAAVGFLFHRGPELILITHLLLCFHFASLVNFFNNFNPPCPSVLGFNHLNVPGVFS